LEFSALFWASDFVNLCSACRFYFIPAALSGFCLAIFVAINLDNNLLGAIQVLEEHLIG